MADAKLEKKAIEVYETLCRALDAHELKYTKEGKDKDGDYTVRFTAVGDDLPMDFVVFVDVERQLVRLMSQMPFKFSEGKRLEGAIVTSRANYLMVDGNFDYDYNTGNVIYKMTSSIRDSLISEDLLFYMVSCAYSMVDEFNDKFLMVDKGAISLEEFFKQY